MNTMIACNNVQDLAEVKPMKKIFRNQIWAKKDENQAQN